MSCSCSRTIRSSTSRRWPRRSRPTRATSGRSVAVRRTKTGRDDCSQPESREQVARIRVAVRARHRRAHPRGDGRFRARRVPRPGVPSVRSAAVGDLRTDPLGARRVRSGARQRPRLTRGGARDRSVMIVLDAGDHWQLVMQPDHADLAARFPAAWGNADFAPLRARDSMIMAAARHDDGWCVRERWLEVHDDGRPVSFIEVDAVSHWRSTAPGSLTCAAGHVRGADRRDARRRPVPPALRRRSRSSDCCPTLRRTWTSCARSSRSSRTRTRRDAPARNRRGRAVGQLQAH